MTAERIVEACEIYLEGFKASGWRPGRLDDESMRATASALGNGLCAPHVAWMVLETIALARAGRLEKAFRWLGFIQGWLWTQGWFSIDTLKRHNMPGGS